MSRFQAVIFDFDLTLCDSSAGFEACHDFAAVSMGLTTPTKEQAGRTIGTPLPLAFVMLYGEDKLELRDDYVRIYQARADEVMTDLTVMLPPAADAVRALKAAGLRLGLVSQKLRYRIEDVLKRDGLLDSFDVVLGAEDVPAFKPDPRGLEIAMERLGATKDNALYVGDTTIDADAAANAGIPFVAVLTGYTGEFAFGPYATLAILPDVGALPELLAGL